MSDSYKKLKLKTNLQTQQKLFDKQEATSDLTWFYQQQTTHREKHW